MKNLQASYMSQLEQQTKVSKDLVIPSKASLKDDALNRHFEYYVVNSFEFFSVNIQCILKLYLYKYTRTC